jgi:hypothetical protein
MAEVLTLTTERKRRKVAIDGVEYELLDRDEIDLAAGVRLRTLLEIGRKKDATEQEAATVSRMLKEWMALLLIQTGSGENRLERLSDDQRVTILTNFLKGSGKATSSPASEPRPA